MIIFIDCILRVLTSRYYFKIQIIGDILIKTWLKIFSNYLLFKFFTDITNFYRKYKDALLFKSKYVLFKDFDRYLKYLISIL